MLQHFIFIVCFSQRFYLYSCHDSSLVALLAALDIYDKQWPPFGADMRFEIYEDSNKKEYIKVSYCGKVGYLLTFTAL